MFNILTFASLALATLYMTVAPVSAHGYVSQPPSRQARCRFEGVPWCGDVRWEPQSVESWKGSLACNGNGARFSELNNEAIWADRYLTVPAGTNTLNFTWTFTALHRTSNFEYFMLGYDEHLLTSYPGNYIMPENPTVHEIPLHGFTGRQTVLSRWNIGDTANAFYSCVDLFIGSSANDAKSAKEQLPLGVAGRTRW